MRPGRRRFRLSSTALAARREAERRHGPFVPRRSDNELVRRVADAMRARREELIALPLSRCWDRLAEAALEEALNDFT